MNRRISDELDHTNGRQELSLGAKMYIFILTLTLALELSRNRIYEVIASVNRTAAIIYIIMNSGQGQTPTVQLGSNITQ